MQTSDSKPTRPSRTARLFSWCWRHKLRATLLLLVLLPLLPVLLIALLVVLLNGSVKAESWWAVHGYHADIEVAGQLLDYDTKQPLVDLLVAVLVRGHRRLDPSISWFYIPLNLGHGGGGGGTQLCSPASAVVRTDAQGRYRYRVSFAEATEGGKFARADTLVRPYKYGYEAVYADDGQPDYGINPSTRARTTYPKYVEFGQARPMAMRKIPADADRDLRIKNSVDLYCNIDPSDRTYRSWVERAAVVSEDAWREWCTPDGDHSGNRSYEIFEMIEASAIQLGLTTTSHHFPQAENDSQHVINATKREDFPTDGAGGLRALLPGYSFGECYPGGASSPCREFTEGEQRLICNYWSRQQNELLKWEYAQ